MVGIQLEDDDGGVPQAHPVTVKNAMVKSGIAKSVAQANVLLFILAIVMVAGIVYFLRIAVPPDPPELGNDVPQRGETIPVHRTL